MKVVDKVQKIKIKKNGTINEFDVLFTFNADNSNKLYIGYTDNVVGANGRKNIYVSSYNEKTKNNNYEPITDIDELSMINKALQQIDFNVQGGNL